jgi:copper(I)-binding protein
LPTPIDIARGGFVQLANEGEEPVMLDGDEIAPGRFVELSISFQEAEAVTVKVPVVAAEDDFEGVELPSEEASP